MVSDLQPVVTPANQSFRWNFLFHLVVRIHLTGNVRKYVGFSVSACSVLPHVPRSVGLYLEDSSNFGTYHSIFCQIFGSTADHRILRPRQAESVHIAVVTMSSLVCTALLAARAFFQEPNQSPLLHIYHPPTFTSGMQQVCFYQWGNGVNCAEVRKILYCKLRVICKLFFLGFYGGFLMFLHLFLYTLFGISLLRVYQV